MELTSQAINEAEFSMARRGYDPDQVDEFLEKLAVAVDKQNEALAEARERASMAERRASEAERKLAERPERVVEAGPAAGVAEDTSARSAQLTAAAEAELETLQRTLVLAQKTADATVRDAEEEARRMIAKAEADARAAQETTKDRLLKEIAKLDADRLALQGDVDALEGHLAEQRRHVEAAIGDLQRLLSEPDRLRSSPSPALSSVTAGGPGQPPEPQRAVDEAATVAPAPPAAPVVEAGSGSGDGGVEPTDGPSAGVDGGADEEAWARFAPAAPDDDVDSGPPTQPVLRLDDLDEPAGGRSSGGEDAYLSELRKAMLDDRGAPDIDEAYGDDRESRQRFGRRR